MIYPIFSMTLLVLSTHASEDGGFEDPRRLAQCYDICVATRVHTRKLDASSSLLSVDIGANFAKPFGGGANEDERRRRLTDEGPEDNHPGLRKGAQSTDEGPEDRRKLNDADHNVCRNFCHARHLMPVGEDLSLYKRKPVGEDPGHEKRRLDNTIESSCKSVLLRQTCTEKNPCKFHTRDDNVFTHALQIPSDSPVVVFKVKAKNDAHIALLTPGDSPKSYEVVLGGWGNTRSVLRPRIRYMWEELLVDNTPQRLSGNEFRYFWAMQTNGSITVGTGKGPADPNSQTIFHQLHWWREAASEVQIMTGFGSTGDWYVHFAKAQ